MSDFGLPRDYEFVISRSPAHLSSLTSSSFRSYLNEVQSVASRRSERKQRYASPHFLQADFWLASTGIRHGPYVQSRPWLGNNSFDKPRCPSSPNSPRLGHFTRR